MDGKLCIAAHRLYVSYVYIPERTWKNLWTKLKKDRVVFWYVSIFKASSFQVLSLLPTANFLSEFVISLCGKVSGCSTLDL